MVIDAERTRYKVFEGSQAVLPGFERSKSAVTPTNTQGTNNLGWFNVRDPAFGAKGNDTDDTQAFQAAIDASPIGGTIYVPPADPGKAYLLSNLTIRKPLTLMGPSGFGSVLKA